MGNNNVTIRCHRLTPNDGLKGQLDEAHKMVEDYMKATILPAATKK